jgi:hypothetical protein
MFTADFYFHCIQDRKLMVYVPLSYMATKDTHFIGQGSVLTVLCVEYSTFYVGVCDDAVLRREGYAVLFDCSSLVSSFR